MKFDSYPRFLKSDVYRQSLVAEIEGGLLHYEEGEEERENKARGFFWKVPVLKLNVFLGNDLSYTKSNWSLTFSLASGTTFFNSLEQFW